MSLSDGVLTCGAVLILCSLESVEVPLLDMEAVSTGGGGGFVSGLESLGETAALLLREFDRLYKSSRFSP